MEKEFLKDFLKQTPSNKTIVDWDDIGLIANFFPDMTIEYSLADKPAIEEGFNIVNSNKILASWLFDLKSFYPALTTGRILFNDNNQFIEIELTVELPFSFGLEKTQEFLQKNHQKWKKNLEHLSQKQSYRVSQKLSERVTTLRMNSEVTKRSLL